MSYNWTPASTPQGRERLFEILKKNHHVGIRRTDLKLLDFIRWNDGQMFCGLIDMEDNIHAYEIDEYIDENGENLQFLDPSPQHQHPDENGLLPCPFCGGKAAVGEHYLPYSRFITNCQSCEAESSIFTTARLAIAAWNKRA